MTTSTRYTLGMRARWAIVGFSLAIFALTVANATAYLLHGCGA